MKKAEWKARALAAELELRLGPPLTFDTLTVCFKGRTVTWQGRIITAGEPDCLSLPIMTMSLQRPGL